MVTVFVVWTLLASLITGAMYAWDKRAARNNDPRIAEVTLLSWSAMGGWPGGWIVGKMIHHKTSKPSYQIKFAMAILVHVAFVVVIWVALGNLIR